MDKYGVRICPLDDEIILVKQTVKKPGANTYIVDIAADGQHREAHVNIADDQEIAQAVRAALPLHAHAIPLQLSLSDLPPSGSISLKRG